MNRRDFTLLLASPLLALGPISALPAFAAGQSHGLSTFGDLKYPADFKHFDYVNPNAPKGGEIRSWQLDTFDNFNPLILKGVVAAGADVMGGDSNNWLYDSLMSQSRDEPDALYALIAESVELGPDRGTVSFNLDSRARWQDGTPITSEDVIFTYTAVMKDGHPKFQLLFRDVAGVAAEGPRRVTFTLKPGNSRRDLPLQLARLPILSRAWFASREFNRTTLEPPLPSGPYKVEKVEPGRSIIYRRDTSYWAKDLPVNRGRFNFDIIRYEYFRDRDIAFEALFSGVYDYRVEVTARNWASGYDERPAVKSGFIKRETLIDGTPSGVQAFFLNTRRPELADRRVRMALNYAFDFEWMSKHLFYGLYKRTRSMFANSDLEATGVPDGAELALLEPFRAELPPELFTEEFQSPATDGSGNPRDNLRKAQRLLTEAGWVVKNGQLVNARTGAPFKVEFLEYERSGERLINPFIRNLERLGIQGNSQATVRLVDLSSFENRMRSFDFDVTMRRFSQSLTPGIDQQNIWSSQYADMVGGLNLSGIKDRVVDALVEKIVDARDRPGLLAAAHALDRVLMWGYYTIPHWYSGTFRVAYWDRFGRAPVQPKYDPDAGIVDTWWIDAEKEKKLPARQQTGGK